MVIMAMVTVNYTNIRNWLGIMIAPPPPSPARYLSSFDSQAREPQFVESLNGHLELTKSPKDGFHPFIPCPGASPVSVVHEAPETGLLS